VQIYRDTDSDANGRTRIAIPSATATTYTDTTPTLGVPYWYWVKFTTSSGSGNSGSATAVRVGVIRSLTSVQLSSAMSPGWNPVTAGSHRRRDRVGQSACQPNAVQRGESGRLQDRAHSAVVDPIRRRKLQHQRQAGWHA
jgi:hypothetical protein